MTWYEIFPQILNMSLTASVIICFVLLCRLLLKRTPKIYSYVLWSVVIFRLLCPVSLSAPFSVLGIFDTPVLEHTSENTSDKASVTSTVAYIPTDIVHTEYPEVTLPIPLEFSVTFATYLWMIGIMGMLVSGIVSYVRLRSNIVGALKLRDNIYVTDHIPGPFVIGMINSKIYLPSELDEKEHSYIILHEKHHIHRGDPIFKMVAYIALCIHWFNPLVWLFFKLFVKDMEMSCDEAVVNKLGENIRADYSASLLQLATGRQMIFGSPLAFGETEPAGRIKNLSRWKKPTLVISAFAIVLCIIAVVVSFFNPAVSKEENIVTKIELENNPEKEVLKDYFKIFLQGGQIDEQGIQMAKKCQEIISKMGEDILTETKTLHGQEWFQLFYGIAKSLEQRYTEEELQNEHPAVCILLEAEQEFIAEYGALAETKSEINWQEIMERYMKGMFKEWKGEE